MSEAIQRLLDSLDHLLNTQPEAIPETSQPPPEDESTGKPEGRPPHSPMLGSGQQLRSGDEPALSVEKTLPMALEALHDAEVRDRATAALIRLRDAAVPSLLGLMHDDNPDVRRAASWALAQIKDRRMVLRLKRGAEWTYYKVHHDGGPRAVRALIKALREGSLESAVASAVALGRLGAVRALPELTEATNDRYPMIRLAAIWALGQIGAQESIPHLLDALHDSDPTIHHVAADALTTIGTSEALAGLGAWQLTQGAAGNV